MIVADISDYQEGFDVDAYADAGHEFLILKASEGGGWRSRFMTAWRDRAHERGLMVGLYHFLRANSTDAEVGNFGGATGGLRDNEVPICDWEESADGAQATAWCSAIEAQTGRRPILYSYAPWLAAHDTSQLTRFPLWIAGYGPNDGHEHAYPGTDRWAPFQDGPGVFPHDGRAIGWQYTSRGHVAGFDGPDLDVSRFDLSVADVARLCGSAPPADPDPLHLGDRLLMRIG